MKITPLYQSLKTISKHSFSTFLVVFISQKKEAKVAIMKMEKDHMEFRETVCYHVITNIEPVTITAKSGGYGGRDERKDYERAAFCSRSHADTTSSGSH